MKKIVIGVEEILTLPDLDIEVIARIDTGAQTSALHVERLLEEKIGGKRWVSFDVNKPVDDKVDFAFRLPVLAKRKIKSSNGTSESRPVIRTHLVMNGHRWSIELTLANRDSMTYPMLLGREAMGKRVLVDPSTEHLLKQTEKENKT